MTNNEDSVANRAGESVVDALDQGADVAAVMAIFQQGVIDAEAAGEMAPARRAMLNAEMASFAMHAEGAKSDDLAVQIASLEGMKAVMQNIAHARLDPSNLPSPPAESHAHRTLVKLEPTFRAIAHSEQTTYPDAEIGQLRNLSFERQPRVRDALARSGDDDATARALEAEMARPLAVDVNRWLRRHHLTLADPYWPTARVNENATAIFYSGTQTIAQLVCSAVDDHDLGLDMLFGSGSGTGAQQRWHDIRQAAVCVFDFVGFQRSWPLARKVPYAQAAYDLGIALTLGRPVVVVSSTDAYVPFDVDVAVTNVSGSKWGADDASVVAEAIDAAFYQPQRTGGHSSLEATCDVMRKRYGDHLDAVVSVPVSQLDHGTETDSLDPIRTAALVNSVLAALGPEAPVAILPSWEGLYPQDRRCFHITGFGIERAERVKQLVSESCTQQPIAMGYLRGDDATDANIIRSIWQEICRASHVVVDVSALNLNALIELGMAHVLGRPALVITQDPSGSPTIPSLAKARRLRYSFDTEGEAKLWAALWRFLGDKDAPQRHQEAQQIDLRDSTTSGPERGVEVAADDVDVDDTHGYDELQCALAAMVLQHIEQVLADVPPGDSESDAAMLQYIYAVPGLLEGLYRSALEQNELARVEPLLDQIVQYFFLVDDLVPDHLGVFGLLDDAYVALRCIEKLNEWTLSFGNPALLDVDLAGINEIAASVLGAEITSQLDASIDWQITKASMKSWFGRNQGKALLGGAAALVAVNAVAGASNSGGGYSSSWDAIEAQMAGW